MSTQVAIDAVLELAGQLKNGDLGVTELVVVTNEAASDDEDREKPTYEEDKRRILKIVSRLKTQLRALEKRKSGERQARQSCRKRATGWRPASVR